MLNFKWFNNYIPYFKFAQENLNRVETEMDTVLSNLYLQVLNTAQESQAVSNDVITRLTGSMFSSATSHNPELIFRQ